MKNLHYITTAILLQWFIERIALQQQLIETQQQVIALQQRIDQMTPKNAPDEEILWHIASGGIMSKEAALSEDVRVVKKFLKWNQDMAKKNIKPYVNPKVYMECLQQMTRGLPERVALLETRHQMKDIEKRVAATQQAAQN
jgi:hypothetical protein